MALSPLVFIIPDPDKGLHGDGQNVKILEKMNNSHVFVVKSGSNRGSPMFPTLSNFSAFKFQFAFHVK